jgi:hypothetical protein
MKHPIFTIPRGHESEDGFHFDDASGVENLQQAEADAARAEWFKTCRGILFAVALSLMLWALLAAGIAWWRGYF